AWSVWRQEFLKQWLVGSSHKLLKPFHSLRTKIGGRMKPTSRALRKKGVFRFAMLLTAAAAILGAMASLPFDTGKAAPGASEIVKELYKRPAPNFDLNVSRNLPNVRQATSEQLSALNNFKTAVNAP